MLGKLIKYEWRGYKISLIVIFAIIISTTLLTGILITTINPNYDDVIENFSTSLAILSFMLYYFGIIGCTLGSMLIIAIRFYKTCYTDQGYLTHTLPASPTQLLTAKIITAVLQFLLVIAGIVLSVITLIQIGYSHIVNLLGDMYTKISLGDLYKAINVEFIDEMGMSLTMYIVVMLIFALISCISAIITNLGCVSLGQLFTRHRIIGAIIAYFGLNVIMQVVSFFASIPMYIRMDNADSAHSYATPIEIMGPTFLIIMGVTVVIAIIMYFVNLHMMTKKLNLE